MAKTISRNCSIGKHKRCLGTVIVFPPVDGQRIQPCQCSAADCPHAARGAAAASENETTTEETAS